ncbi:hypothetical protein WJ0W_000413 [Paenibacillus melissococcoides]|uniref:Uncharacterized protein n=1 Tax=Paenibacillus melissococcoides TaxID=2912268 RepID=A0ABN8TX08_9BACL|nr:MULTISPECIES: hypothetical protein [Paenibacillus]MEB9897594.1 hypothetical protein [Bacillus cereus]CAH8243187.1 hypothetical protein WJ0W_000413 [Paenibacillus melissococcoides]CAH8703923.1 hypothetical protein WDD9_000406 [Paenibacillus melissococcoides]CAH8707041.1 hypothetical protein HTL2_001490 [Paenibacillus melissococcoides]GIO81806.1 hypothetical protein J6TS7_54160 [Paenibacillus dendritiformis]
MQQFKKAIDRKGNLLITVRDFEKNALLTMKKKEKEIAIEINVENFKSAHFTLNEDVFRQIFSEISQHK